MLSVPADGLDKHRICPVCGCEIDSKICKKDGVTTFAADSVAGRFVKLRMERGNLPGSELLKTAKLGYDLRIDFSKVKDSRALAKDLTTYFAAIEDFSKPGIIVFSRDQRNQGEFLQGIFEAYAKESSAETALVYGLMSTTMTPYLGAMFSFKEKKVVTALHATASHNPPSYNGIKNHSGRFNHNIFPELLEFSKQVEGKAVLDSYVQWCTQASPHEGEINFDLVNGAAAIPMPKIVSRLYPNAKLFNDKALPNFGDVKPEPGWFVGWQEFGVTFDGDADRCPFYTGSKMIFFSRFLAGMVKEGLFKEKRVIADQRTPPHVVNFLEEHGVKVQLGMIGNTNQVGLSAKENALWFEENWHSGGYMAGGARCPWGEAPFAATYWLGNLKVSVEHLLKDVPNFEFSMEKFHTAPGFNDRIVGLAEKRGMDYLKLPTGGLRLENDKGHILFRESNTEIGAARLSASGIDTTALKENLAYGRKLVAAVEGKALD